MKFCTENCTCNSPSGYAHNVSYSSYNHYKLAALINLAITIDNQATLYTSYYAINLYSLVCSSLLMTLSSTCQPGFDWLGSFYFNFKEEAIIL